MIYSAESVGFFVDISNMLIKGKFIINSYT